VNDQFDESPAESAWRVSAFVWAILIAAAWIVFELTANRLLVVATFCLKAGWQDARTAFWIRRRDPDRDRRDVLVPVMLAWGLVKVMFAGLGAGLLAGGGLLILTLAGLNPNAPQQFRTEVVPLLAAGTVGFLLSAAAMYYAVPFAALNKRRIWVDSFISNSREANLWPPIHFRVNRFGWVWWTAVVEPVIGGLGNWAWHLGPQRNVRPDLSVAVLAAIVIGSSLWGLIAAAFYRATVARSPEECWPEIGDSTALSSPADPLHRNE
jgi:hypothetical protein